MSARPISSEEFPFSIYIQRDRTGLSPVSPDTFSIRFSQTVSLVLFKSHACLLSPIAAGLIGDHEEFDISQKVSSLSSQAVETIVGNVEKLLDGKPIVVYRNNFEQYKLVFEVLGNDDFSHQFTNAPNSFEFFYLSLKSLKNVKMSLCETAMDIPIMRNFKVPTGIFKIFFPDGVKAQETNQRLVESSFSFFMSLFKGIIPPVNQELSQYLLSIGFNNKLLADLQKRNQASSSRPTQQNGISTPPSPRRAPQRVAQKDSAVVKNARKPTLNSSSSQSNFYKSKSESSLNYKVDEIQQPPSFNKLPLGNMATPHQLAPVESQLHPSPRVTKPPSKIPPIPIALSEASLPFPNANFDVSSLQSQVQNLEKDKEKYKGLYISELKQKAEAEKNHKNQVQSLEDSVQSLSNEKKDLMSRVQSNHIFTEKLQIEKDQLAQEVEKMRKQVEILQGTNIKLQNKMRKKEEIILKYEKIIKEKDEHILQLEGLTFKKEETVQYPQITKTEQPKRKIQVPLDDKESKFNQYLNKHQVISADISRLEQILKDSIDDKEPEKLPLSKQNFPFVKHHEGKVAPNSSFQTDILQKKSQIAKLQKELLSKELLKQDETASSTELPSKSKINKSSTWSTELKNDKSFRENETRKENVDGVLHHDLMEDLDNEEKIQIENPSIGLNSLNFSHDDPNSEGIFSKSPK